MAKFAIGDRVLIIGEGWKRGRTGYVDAIVDEIETNDLDDKGERVISPAAYHVFFPEVNRKVYVTENELTLDTRIQVDAEEVIVIDSDQIKDAATAGRIGERMNRLVIHVPGGMKGINKVNRADLKTALDATDPAINKPVNPTKK